MIRHFVRCPQGLYPCFRSRPLNPPRTIRCAIPTLLRHRVTSPRRRRCQRACFPFRHRQNLIRIPSVQIGSFQLQGIWLQQVFSCKEILSREKKKYKSHSLCHLEGIGEGKVSNLARWLEHSAFKPDISIIQSPASVQQTLFQSGPKISLESINIQLSLWIKRQQVQCVSKL